MPSALTAFSNSCATASGNKSLRARMATRLRSLFFSCTSLAIGTDTEEFPVSVAKMLFVALVEDLGRRRRRREHRHRVLLGNGARRLGCAGAERREQEVDLILRDHPLGGLYRARRVRGIIGVDDLYLVGLSAGPDPAFGGGRFGPQIVAAFLLQALRGERAGQRQWGADLDDVLCSGRNAE